MPKSKTTELGVFYVRFDPSPAQPGQGIADRITGFGRKPASQFLFDPVFIGYN